MNRTTTLPRTLAYLLRQLLIGVLVCTFVALFLSAAFRDPFGRSLVFSLCVGLTCQLLITAGLRAAAMALNRRRADDPTLAGEWPGWLPALPIIAAGIWAGLTFGHRLAGWLLGIKAEVPGLDNPRSLFIIVTVSLLASLGFTGVTWARARLAASQAQAQRAQRAAAENQLKLLESQLEPHMLFNTLANLRVLIALDPPRAQAMLDRLIAFLRATLNASRVGTHALAVEFDRLGDYLALMQVRMGPRLQFAFDLPPDLRDVPVPPLLLQPLVENSIQHGLEPKLDGGRIDVRAGRVGKTLVLIVSDSGVGLSAVSDSAVGLSAVSDSAVSLPAASDSSVGLSSAPPPTSTRFGTQQVCERLAALYGSAASFTLTAAAGGGTSARITLPLTRPP